MVKISDVFAVIASFSCGIYLSWFMSIKGSVQQAATSDEDPEYAAMKRKLSAIRYGTHPTPADSVLS